MKVVSTEFKMFPVRDWKSEQIFGWYKNRDFFTIIRSFEPLEVAIGSEIYVVDREKIAFIGSGRQFDIRQACTNNAYIITFTAFFYEKSIADTALLNSELFFDVNQSVKIVDAQDNETDFMIRIANGSQNYGGRFFDLVMHNCIESLLLDGIRGVKFDFSMHNYESISTRGIVNTFSILVHKHFKNQMNVQFYADKLNVTPRKLTEICMAILDKTAKNVISDIVVKEALRYIRNTNLSISQIAYEMGFTDESNFRHFVKKNTGNIPISYRQIPVTAPCNN